MAAIRSHRTSAPVCIESAEIGRGDLRVRRRGVDQRQGHGPVEKVGAAGLAGPRGRPGDVEDVVEQLEGEADVGAEGAEGIVVAADPAGALEQRRGLQPAAIEVASLRDRGVVGVLSLGELPLAKRDRGGREQRHRPPVVRLGEERESAREEQVAEGGRAIAAGLGEHGRAAAAKRGIVEHVVVDEGRHVDELDRGGAAHLGVSRGLAGA